MIKKGEVKMPNVKIAIFYYSSTGTNFKLARWAEKAAREAGAEVKLCRVEELAPESVIEGNAAWKKHYLETKDIIPVATLSDLEWADAYLFSMPTRFGNIPSQMKHFLDQTGNLWSEGRLMNKVVSAMSSATNPNSGQEQTITDLYTTMMNWGAIIAAPGFTNSTNSLSEGNSYGTSATFDQVDKLLEDIQKGVEHQTKRTIQIANWIKQGIALEK